MIRKYLKKVALHYNIHLMIQEYKNAGLEEVGSKYDDGGVHQNTIYITNLRDPVRYFIICIAFSFVQTVSFGFVKVFICS